MLVDKRSVLIFDNFYIENWSLWLGTKDDPPYTLQSRDFQVREE